MMARGPVRTDDELREAANKLLSERPWLSRHTFVVEMHSSWGRLKNLGIKFPRKSTPQEARMRGVA